MPKVHNTRRQRAEELLNRIRNGPSFSDTRIKPLTVDDVTEQYRLWSRSWVVDELVQLVPELRGEKKP